MKSVRDKERTEQAIHIPTTSPNSIVKRWTDRRQNGDYTDRCIVGIVKMFIMNNRLKNVQSRFEYSALTIFQNMTGLEIATKSIKQKHELICEGQKRYFVQFTPPHTE